MGRGRAQGPVQRNREKEVTATIESTHIKSTLTTPHCRTRKGKSKLRRKMYATAKSSTKRKTLGAGEKFYPAEPSVNTKHPLDHLGYGRNSGTDMERPKRRDVSKNTKML